MRPLPAALCALIFALPADAGGGQRRASVDSYPLTDCPGGSMIVGSFPLGGDSPYTVAVFHEGYKTLADAREALRRRGLDPAALVNGGYFDPERDEILSYYKSSFFATHAPHNSSQGPRACMAFDPKTKKLAVLQSSDDNYALWSRGVGEVYCAGPQLVENGADVSARQSCAEHFLPRCRSDHSDSGADLRVDAPRTGSCVTEDGTLKLFSANSRARRCGATARWMARTMVKHGCADGMNHDGGGSAKMFVSVGGESATAAGDRENRGRAVPVWLAVLRGSVQGASNGGEATGSFPSGLSSPNSSRATASSDESVIP